MGCFEDYDHSALPEYFYTPTGLDFNKLWPNLKPLAEACSEQAKRRNFTCFGIQYHQECWGGNGEMDAKPKQNIEIICK